MRKPPMYSSGPTGILNLTPFIPGRSKSVPLTPAEQNGLQRDAAHPSEHGATVLRLMMKQHGLPPVKA